MYASIFRSEDSPGTRCSAWIRFLHMPRMLPMLECTPPFSDLRILRARGAVRGFGFFTCLECFQCSNVRLHFLLVEVVISRRDGDVLVRWMDVTVLVTIRRCCDGVDDVNVLESQLSLKQITFFSRGCTVDSALAAVHALLTLPGAALDVLVNPAARAVHCRM